MLFDRQARIEAGESHSLKVSGLVAVAGLGVGGLLTVEEVVEVERSRLWVERLVRAVEGSGWRIELLAEGSLARLAMEAAEMLDRVSLYANLFNGLINHSCPPTVELNIVSEGISNMMGGLFTRKVATLLSAGRRVRHLVDVCALTEDADLQENEKRYRRQIKEADRSA